MTSNALGIHLTLLIGPTVAVPAPPELTEALQSVQVKHNDKGRSGFQITFGAGRGGPFDLRDYALIAHPLLKPFNRVILVVTLDARPQVLMDGIITHQQLNPSATPGGSTLTITGEDLTVLLDQEEKVEEHPAQTEAVIALKLIAGYAQYGLIPLVIPPEMLDLPLPLERVPIQIGTDLEYLLEMAERYGYVFYIAPGPVPFTNTAYWGPPIRVGIPQRALSVNLGSETNVSNIQFQMDAQQPVLVNSTVQDRTTNQKLPLRTFLSTRPPLAAMPTSVTNGFNTRRTRMDASGLTLAQAYARAQGLTEASQDTVTVSGELDALRYGDLLQARGLVGLRGVGYSYDGFYYVKAVTHNIQGGGYRQQFTLTREGLGSTTPAVIP